MKLSIFTQFYANQDVPVIITDENFLIRFYNHKAYAHFNAPIPERILELLAGIDLTHTDIPVVLLKKGEPSVMMSPIIVDGEKEGYAFEFQSIPLKITNKFFEDEPFFSFISTLSHETNMPLTMILSTVTYLKKVLPNIDPKLQKYITTLDLNTKRLMRFCDHAIYFAKISTAGKGGLTFSTVDLVSYLKTLCQSVSETDFAMDGKITFKTKLSKLYTVVDTTLLDRILMNLFSNSFKYVKEQPKVKVTLKNDDSYAYLTVSDNGVGMSRELIKKVTLPFVKGDESTGFGLGLAIIKNYVEIHGGSISIRSKEGSGTSFTFTLPIKAPPGSCVFQFDDVIRNRALSLELN